MAFKKPKATKYYEVGSVYSKQEQQKTSNYKYLCFSDHSEEIQNLTQKVGKLESKLEEEKRQMAEDTMQKLNKVQTGFACSFWVFSPLHLNNILQIELMV